jgi:hypothetical protein
MPLHPLLDALPAPWIHNYIAAFEAGRVQKHPQARFVNGSGECCVVGALAGVATSAELVKTVAWTQFLGGPLEQLSRLFEARRITGQQVYEEALLVMAERAPAEVAVTA